MRLSVHPRVEDFHGVARKLRVGVTRGNPVGIRMKNLQVLPRVKDSWSYLYIEHARIDQENFGICIHDVDGRTYVPCASFSLLMLGPGTSVTHAAISTMAECGCLVAWVGEQGVRFYAQGLGETRSSRNLLRQARLWANEQTRLAVVRRMYELRLGEPIPVHWSLRQIRGREGSRVRAAYAKCSEEWGIPWKGREYRRDEWDSADPVNRALSAANACLYGVCHAAIVALGYSPGIGFIHTGKMMSFVYDIGDLYKVEFTLPVAFEEASKGEANLESRVRRRCRDLFYEKQLLKRIVTDLDWLFGLDAEGGEQGEESEFDVDEALPGELWDPEGNVAGGRNFGGRE